MKTYWNATLVGALISFLLTQTVIGAETSSPPSDAQQKTPTRAIAAPAPSPTAGGPQTLRFSSVLCQIVECGTPAPPNVTSVDKLPLDPNHPVTVTPGGHVVLNGTNFNDKNGQFGKLVLIIGDPNNFLHLEFPLLGLQWSDDAAMGTIPAISGHIDQLAHLQLRRSDGVWSVPLPVQFYAERDVTFLTANSMAQGGIECSTNADQNQCNFWSDFGAKNPPPDLGGSPNSLAIYAVHNSFLGTENGVDQFHLTLKNGWVFRDRAAPFIGTSSCQWSDPSALSSTFSRASASDFTYTIQWTSTCQFDYGMWLMIIGPKGVSPN